MLRFWQDRVKGVNLSRSRPYHKNDNRFVEQKNSTLIRDLLGYDRLDTVSQTLAVNYLYDRTWFYYNFFQPVMRLEKKEINPGPDDQSHCVKRIYDDPRTPFDRLCKTNAILPAYCDLLRACRNQISPTNFARKSMIGLTTARERARGPNLVPLNRHHRASRQAYPLH